MKILFVQGTEKISGGERIALDIANNLRNDFESVFFLPQKPTEEALGFYKEFNPHYPKKIGFREVIKELINVINLIKPDIIHAQGTRAAFFIKLAYLVRSKKERFIYTLHGIHFIHKTFPFNRLFLIFERLTNKLADTLICVGEDDFNLAKKLRLIKEEKLILIKNGIDFKKFESIEKGFLREKFNIKNEIIITTACRLHYQKDVETLIRSINLLRNYPLIFFIVGDGPERKKLEILTKNFGLENKVKFLGFQKEVEKILADSDIFVLSTKWEGLPLVILEALALKKPVIGSAVGGVKELIKDNLNGFLFQLGSEKELAQKIRILIGDENLRKKFGENGFNPIKENYNLQEMINGYSKHYENSSSK